MNDIEVIKNNLKMRNAVGIILLEMMDLYGQAKEEMVQEFALVRKIYGKCLKVE